jgi:hypothetical protein
MRLRSAPFALLLPLFTLACDGKDPAEGDGSSDEGADGGGDGGEELPEEPDPNADDDGDGYLNGWEEAEGTDPNDAASVIYTGGWPYNPEKDGIVDPGLAGFQGQVGDTLPRFALLDQFDDTVDVYDFSGAVPTLIDVSAVWCGPCNGLSQWLSGVGDDYGFSSLNPDLPGLIASGDVRWITILGEDRRGGEPTLEVLEYWDSSYHSPVIPVLGGEGAQEVAYTLLGAGWPTVYLLNPDFTIHTRPGSPSDITYYDPVMVAGAE